MTKSIQSRGGKARAEQLLPEERTAIAQAGAAARWNVGSLIPKETHDGILKIGGHELACSVLDNGVRVFSTRGITRAMGGKQTGRPEKKNEGALQIPPFLAAGNIRPFISNELMVRLISPLHYRPKHGGRSAFGYEATLLPDICASILDANKAAPLRPNQEHLVRMADILLRGFAKVGIIALVDEATGYQEERAKDELTKILEAYVTEELRPWIRTFPNEFFKQIYRLQDWPYVPGSAKRTPYVGKLINKYVYEQLPPGVLGELRRLNPVTDKGYRRYKFFQFLTADTGNIHLDRQITAVMTIMRVSDDKFQFERNFDKVFPAKGVQEKLPLVIDVPKELKA